ncbi:hypothetical protein [Myroides odoratimimus]|nr:hypothetical protein [Myroides odoratimimus]
MKLQNPNFSLEIFYRDTWGYDDTHWSDKDKDPVDNPKDDDEKN